MANIEPMNLESEDLVADRIEQVKQLFPEIATEGDGSVDFEKLRLIMGGQVNESDDRYAFTWPGKRDAIRQSQAPSTATLRPAVDESRGRDGEDGSFDSDNLYIEGDNLEVLEAIAELEPRRVLMLDSILTDTLKLNVVQIFKCVSDRAGVEVELRTA